MTDRPVNLIFAVSLAPNAPAGRRLPAEVFRCTELRLLRTSTLGTPRFRSTVPGERRGGPPQACNVDAALRGRRTETCSARPAPDRALRSGQPRGSQPCGSPMRSTPWPTRRACKRRQTTPNDGKRRQTGVTFTQRRPAPSGGHAFSSLRPYNSSAGGVGSTATALGP
jgi:hypothetical protein